MLKNILNQVVQGASTPTGTGAIAGAGVGLLSGLLLGNKKMGGIGAVGGTAALGALAFAAINKWQAGKGAPAGSPQTQSAALNFDAMPPQNQEEYNRALLAAIVAAAKADGVFDPGERKYIQEQTEKLNDPQMTAWVQQEISKPLDVGAIAALATSPEMAAELYLASFVIIEQPNNPERKYLDALATKMNIDRQLQRELEGQVV